MSESWVLVAGDFDRRGGMDRANYELARFLVERGDGVHLVGHRVEERLARHVNVVVHAVPRPLGSHLLGARLLARRGLAVARAVTARAPRARVVVNGGNCAWPDVNWVHMVHGAWSVRDEGAPLSVRLKNRIAQRLDRRAERTALATSRLVLANSEKTRADLIERLGVEPGRIRVVQLGTDPESFSPISARERVLAREALGIPDERPVAAFVGMLGYERKKGFDTLLAAWRRLSNEGALDAELLAVGSGALSFWRRRAEALRVAGRVRFLGARDDVERVLAASDVLVAPTRYDAYGLSIHEALCREIPALVTRAAGVAEQYPDALGDLILPDPEDDAMLAARLRDCFTARDRFAASLRALGARLRTRRWTDMAREIVAVVEAEVPR